MFFAYFLNDFISIFKKHPSPSTFGRCVVKMHWNNFRSHYEYRITIDICNWTWIIREFKFPIPFWCHSLQLIIFILDYFRLFLFFSRLKNWIKFYDLFKPFPKSIMSRLVGIFALLSLEFTVVSVHCFWIFYPFLCWNVL